MDARERKLRAKIPGDEPGSRCANPSAPSATRRPSAASTATSRTAASSRWRAPSRTRTAAAPSAPRARLNGSGSTTRNGCAPRSSGSAPAARASSSPISWTEALDTIAENLQRLKAESGPESVVFYCGYPKQLRPFLQRLAMLYGSPNYCTESSACFTAMAMGWRLDYGQMAGPDLANTKCLLVWSGNPFTRARRTPAGSWTPATAG